MRTAAILLVAGAGCGATPPPCAADAREPARVTETHVIAELLQRGCLGTCPVYSVDVCSDGRVVYRGEAFVAASGRRTARLTAPQREELERAFAAADFESIPALGPWDGTTDAPSTVLVHRKDGATWRVSHEPGRSPEVAARLRVLEQEIERVTGAARWVGRVR